MVAGFATIVFTYFAISKKDDQLLAIGIVISFLFASLVIVQFKHHLAVIYSDILSRKNSVDFAHTSGLPAYLTILAGYLVRFLYRIPHSFQAWAIACGLTLGVVLLSIGVLWLHFEGYSNARSSLCSIHVFLPFTASTSFIVWFVTSFVASAKEAYLEEVVENKLSTELREIISTSSGGDARKIRHDVVEKDAGPLCIISVSAQDLTKQRSDNPLDCSLYDCATNETKTPIYLLLADPTSDAVIHRNRRLNGRYMEYYASPVIRALLLYQYICGQISDSIVEIRLYSTEPAYRIVATKDNVVLQRYGKWSHGIDDDAICFARSIHCKQLEPIYSMLELGSFNPNSPEISGVIDPGTGEFMPADNTVYAHYIDTFRRYWGRETRSPFLVDWEMSKLQRLGLLCGVKQKIINSTTPQPIAAAICDRLNLGVLYQNAMSVTPKTLHAK